MPGFRPGSRATFVSEKVAKTIDAPSGLVGGEGRTLLKSGPTRSAQTRSANCEERPSLGPDGRRRAKINAYRGKTMEREPTPSAQDDHEGRGMGEDGW